MEAHSLESSRDQQNIRANTNLLPYVHGNGVIEAALQPNTSAPQTRESSTAVQQFAEEIADVKVYFQIIELGRQLFIWVGTDAARMGSVCLASAPGATVPDGRMPSVTALVKGSGEDAGASLAQRLTARCGRSVAVAWNLPEEPEELGGQAVRRLLQELEVMDLIRGSNSLSLQ